MIYLDVEGIAVAELIKQLKAVYPGITIYDAPVKQGLKTPAFQILNPRVSHAKRLSNHAEMRIMFNLNYFPKATTPSSIYDELREVRMKLPYNIQMIGTLHHVHNMDMDISDNVLVTTFDIVQLIHYADAPNLMQALDVDFNNKGDDTR